MKRTLYLLLFAAGCILATPAVQAQKKFLTEKQLLQSYMEELCADTMYGRGYLKEGQERAARYVLRKFKEARLRPIEKNGPMAQAFAYPVNTFPGPLLVAVNGKPLEPGVDYLVEASSSPFSRENMEVTKIDLSKITDEAGWTKIVSTFDETHVFYLQNTEHLCEVLDIKKTNLPVELPKGCFIIPETKKLTWTVSRDTVVATVLYIMEDALPKKMKSMSVDVNPVYEQKFKSENIIGCVPGIVKDSFIVIGAHYDHLGLLGDTTVFPGASDNASGTAMLISLATYFAKHPQRYTMVFIAFAGEEAGLQGSEYFTWHPFMPLDHIRFMINIDIMGDASKGVTVVNATEHPAEFDMLVSQNAKLGYLPEIKSRGPAANSDHHHFTKAGVPAFFIYSNGGKGHYHDVFDKPSEVTLENTGGVSKMIIDFVGELR